MLSPRFESISPHNLVARDVRFLGSRTGVGMLAPHDASTRRFHQVESASKAAGFSLTDGPTLRNGGGTMRGGYSEM
jgi:hypothetical protein